VSELKNDFNLGELKNEFTISELRGGQFSTKELLIENINVPMSIPKYNGFIN